MTYLRHVPPAALPVTLADLKAHLRVEPGDASEDVILDAYLRAAVDHFDGWTGALGRCLLTQTWRLTADRPVPLDGRDRRLAGDIDYAPLFRSRLGEPRRSGFRIELGPEAEVTEVEYLSDGHWVEMDRADVWETPLPGGHTLLFPAPGVSWPVADAVPGAWRTTFTAGYGLAADVPPALKAAILLVAADLAGNRDGKTVASLVANPTVDLLTGPYRTVSV